LKYYYSDRVILDPPDNLDLIIQERQLYVYQNKNAWPYFYLAERLGSMEVGEHLSNVTKGTAYIQEQDSFELPRGAGSSSLKLKDFRYGEMFFDFKGGNEELLVVADSWHPFWKAEADGKQLSIIKTNEIFKGVKLPPGDYTLRMYFDTEPYKKGIPVAIVSWMLFLAALIFNYKHLNKPLFSKVGS